MVIAAIPVVAAGRVASRTISVYHDDDTRSLEGPDFLTWLESKLSAGKNKKAKPKSKR